MMRSISMLAALCLAAPAAAAELAVTGVDEAPRHPDDATWKNVPRAELTLMAQQISPPTGGGAVTGATLQAVHDGEWISIRMEWPDDTRDAGVGVDAFRDAAAIGFPMSDGETSPFMGDAEHPVAIWQWSANHQANNDGQGEFAERYPKVDGVWYADHDAMMSVRVHRWRGVEPVEHFVAHGFGTLTPTPDPSLTGIGVRTDDGWAVVFQRQLATGEPVFSAGAGSQLIAAIWDGGSGEVNGRKAVTMGWTPVALAKP